MYPAGTLVRNRKSRNVWTVIANYGDRAVAVRECSIMNPYEWDVVIPPDKPITHHASPVTTPAQGQAIQRLECSGREVSSAGNTKIEFHEHITDEADLSTFWIFEGGQVVQKIPFADVTRWEAREG